MALGSGEALLTNARLPGELPAVCGVNVTVKETLFPAASVNGNVIPVRSYPEPDSSTVETVTLELAAVSVPVLDTLLPTATLPKVMEAGDTVSCAVGVDNPSPARGMEILEFVASLAMVKLPLAAPAAVGVKVITILRLCPAATAAGSGGGVVTLNLLPLMLIFETMALWSPSEELVTTKEIFLVPPTDTLPKSSEFEDTVNVDESLPVDALGAGARLHPANRAVARNTKPNK